MAGVIRNQLLKEAGKGEVEIRKKRKKKGESDEQDKKKKKKISEKRRIDSDREESAKDSRDGIEAMLGDAPMFDAREDLASSSSDTGHSSSEEDPVDGADGEVDPDEEETPSTSPSALDQPSEHFPLREVSIDAGTKLSIVTENTIVNEEDDEAAVIIKPSARRNVRAGFIIDSDSE